MASPQESPETIMAQALALIDQYHRDREASEEEFRRQGVDPEKLRAYLQSQLTDEGREQVRQTVRADMEAVEQEVRDALTRHSFARPAGKSARRRSMI